jgi:hypothetical protein
MGPGIPEGCSEYLCTACSLGDELTLKHAHPHPSPRPESQRGKEAHTRE